MQSEKSKNAICYNCQTVLELECGQKILRHEECPKCQAYLHCCRMCDFYDKNSYNECREPSAERILEKEKPNFCTYFIFKGAGDNAQSKDDLLDAANALFKK